MDVLSVQIMAIVVTALGLLVSVPFQVFVHEDSTAKPASLKWYKWIQKPEFYLVIWDWEVQMYFFSLHAGDEHYYYVA